jgi:hypothetical protein
MWPLKWKQVEERSKVAEAKRAAQAEKDNVVLLSTRSLKRARELAEVRKTFEGHTLIIIEKNLAAKRMVVAETADSKRLVAGEQVGVVFDDGRQRVVVVCKVGGHSKDGWLLRGVEMLVGCRA